MEMGATKEQKGEERNVQGILILLDTETRAAVASTLGEKRGSVSILGPSVALLPQGHARFLLSFPGSSQRSE